MADGTKSAVEMGRELGGSVLQGIGSVSDAFGDFVTRGFTDFNGFVSSILDSLKSMLSQMISMTVQNKILIPITTALSGLLGGSASAGPLAGQPIFDIASSFDGGGYTGSGARTGGLDGRGGFMAMMHPRERVYDESRGQSRGQQGGVVNNIKVIAPPGSEVSEERQQNSSGGEDLTVMIDRAVSSLARDPSSAISRTLGNSYGVGRQTRKR